MIGGKAWAQEDLNLIRGANEIHLNDTDNLKERHQQALALNDWWDKMTGLTKEHAMKILEKHLDKDTQIPAKVYRALHTLRGFCALVYFK